jgi:hypothetical protein
MNRHWTFSMLVSLLLQITIPVVVNFQSLPTSNQEDAQSQVEENLELTLVSHLDLPSSSIDIDGNTGGWVDPDSLPIGDQHGDDVIPLLISGYLRNVLAQVIGDLAQICPGRALGQTRLEESHKRLPASGPLLGCQVDQQRPDLVGTKLG